MTLRQRYFRDERGATIVEFALVAPVLILVVLACLDFGRALNAYVTVANASREGARYVAVHPDATAATIHDFLAGRIVPLDASALTVAPPVPLRTTDPRWATGAPAPWAVSVTVAYRWDAATAIVGAFFSAASGSRTFAVTSTMETVQ